MAHLHPLTPPTPAETPPPPGDTPPQTYICTHTHTHTHTHTNSIFLSHNLKYNTVEIIVEQEKL